MVTFPVSCIHSPTGVDPDLPRTGLADMEGATGLSAATGLDIDGVGGGTVGEVFLRTTIAFTFKGAPFFSLRIQELRHGKAGKSVRKKRGVWSTYFLVGMLSPARASSSLDGLAPIVMDWLFLFRHSAEVEEREIWPRLPALSDFGVEAGRMAPTPGI